MNMSFQTLLCGFLLIVIGGLGYLNAVPDEQGNISPTALIPAAFGLMLVGCALLVMAKDQLRKHVMHFAAMIGLLGIIGGFVPLIRQSAKGLPMDVTAPAVRHGLLMSLVCFSFVLLCIRSFILARQARQANAIGTI